METMERTPSRRWRPPRKPARRHPPAPRAATPLPRPANRPAAPATRRRRSPVQAMTDQRQRVLLRKRPSLKTAPASPPRAHRRTPPPRPPQAPRPQTLELAPQPYHPVTPVHQQTLRRPLQRQIEVDRHRTPRYPHQMPRIQREAAPALHHLQVRPHHRAKPMAGTSQTPTKHPTFPRPRIPQPQ
jgi:hypothetical protein